MWKTRFIEAVSRGLTVNVTRALPSAFLDSTDGLIHIYSPSFKRLLSEKGKILFLFTYTIVKNICKCYFCEGYGLFSPFECTVMLICNVFKAKFKRLLNITECISNVQLFSCLSFLFLNQCHRSDSRHDEDDDLLHLGTHCPCSLLSLNIWHLFHVPSRPWDDTTACPSGPSGQAPGALCGRWSESRQSL